MMHIDPDGVYSTAELAMALGVPMEHVVAARKAGSLWAVPFGDDWRYLGVWVISWLDAEASRRVGKPDAH